MAAPLNLVPTKQTKAVAHTMAAAARETSPAEAVLRYMHRTPPGQGPALLAYLLKLALDGTPIPDSVAVHAEPDNVTDILSSGGLSQEQELDLTDAYVTYASAQFGVTPGLVLSVARGVKLSRARHAAMWALRQHGISLSRIGEMFSGKDHTSVLYAVRRVEKEPDLLRMAASMMASIRDDQDVA